jgi:hypothetical protein
MSERRELVTLASTGEVNLAALSREFEISRKTAYKWLRRFATEGWSGLADRSQRPLNSPRQTQATIEALVCAVRREHPAWGGRKIYHRLRADGYTTVPAPSTITGILSRKRPARARAALAADLAALRRRAAQRLVADGL